MTLAQDYYTKRFVGFHSFNEAKNYVSTSVCVSVSKISIHCLLDWAVPGRFSLFFTSELLPRASSPRGGIPELRDPNPCSRGGTFSCCSPFESPLPTARCQLRGSLPPSLGATATRLVSPLFIFTMSVTLRLILVPKHIYSRFPKLLFHGAGLRLLRNNSVGYKIFALLIKRKKNRTQQEAIYVWLQHSYSILIFCISICKWWAHE